MVFDDKHKSILISSYFCREFNGFESLRAKLIVLNSVNPSNDEQQELWELQVLAVSI